MKRFLLIIFLLFSSSAHARHVESALSAQKAHIGDFFENSPDLHPVDQLYLIELHIAYNDFSAQGAHRPLNLWYFRARYFDNEMGRFISRDPLGYVDGFSLYGAYFAEGFAMDPMGEKTKKADKYWNEDVSDEEKEWREQCRRNYDRGCVGVTQTHLRSSRGRFPEMKIYFKKLADALKHKSTMKCEFNKDLCKKEGQKMVPKVFGVNFDVPKSTIKKIC